MIWLQAVVCFLAWIGYGVVMRRKSDLIRQRFRGMGRRRRVLYASAGLIGSMVFLMVCLAAIASWGGLTQEGLTLWAWPLVGLVGLFFVHMQVMGAAAMITQVQEEETRRRLAASEDQKSNGSRLEQEGRIS